MDLDDLSSRWQAAFGDCPPIGHLLRHNLPDRWVRFHSLPGSKRLAETESEYAEVLRRAQTVLADLRADDPSDPATLLVVSESWSHDAGPAPRTAAEQDLLPATYWRSVRPDPEDPRGWWTNLWVSTIAAEDSVVPQLIRLAADDQAAVLLAPTSFRWLLAPYDGGMDVIASSPPERDRLALRHGDWLSARADGL